RHGDGVRPRLPLNRQNDRTVAVVPARYLVVLNVVEYVTELVEVNRGAVSVGDYHLPELLRIRELSVRFDGGGFVEAPERPRRHADVLRADRRRDFIDSNPAIGE